MLKLTVPGSVRISPLTIERPTIVKITTNRDFPTALRQRAGLLVEDLATDCPSGFQFAPYAGARGRCKFQAKVIRQYADRAARTAFPGLRRR